LKTLFPVNPALFRSGMKARYRLVNMMSTSVKLLQQHISACSRQIVSSLPSFYEIDGFPITGVIFVAQQVRYLKTRPVQRLLSSFPGEVFSQN
jgi:hypothetical protein